LPLFLELVRQVADEDPELARAALHGLRRYQEAEPASPRPERPIVARQGPATLRDCGGSGPPLLLVPSLINPPTILDLDEDCSLANALGSHARVLLLDWGAARERQGLDLSGHIEQLLVPLARDLGPAWLTGYCLGGTLVLEAARQLPQVRGIVTLASPWRFAGYAAAARERLGGIWRSSRLAAEQLGALPMEVLQASFWSLDPRRTVAKFAAFGQLGPDSPEARRFVALEEWANSGEPLPLPAAREMVEDLFEADAWHGRPLPSCPVLHVTAASDRIVPATTAAPGPSLESPAGHVGMVVGRRAPELLHLPLRRWLEAHGTAR